jgi:enoyl-CoA hydratase/carnithine racemase
LSEPFNQLSLTRCSGAYWRVTFNHPPINLLDDNTVPELEHLLGLAEAGPKLKVIVFDSANPDFFIAHFNPAAGFKNLVTRKPNGHFPWTDIVDRLAPAGGVRRGRARKSARRRFAVRLSVRHPVRKS